MTLSRCYFNVKNSSPKKTLHIFTDATLRAYGSVAYICNKNVSTIIMVKRPFATLKQFLPQLELMAALIGARLANHLQYVVDVEEIVFWSNSNIASYWLWSVKQLSRIVWLKCVIYQTFKHGEIVLQHTTLSIYLHVL